MDTIYHLLKANRKISLASYKKLRNLKGLWCYVKCPVTSGTIFGKEDLVEYDESLTKKVKLLIFGLFQEGSQGMYDYDTFIDGCFALTTYEEKLPLQTLIEVDFCNRRMTFKVDDHRNIMPSMCEQLFIKNVLVPAT